MQYIISDAALFFKRIGRELMCMFATYVDDSLHALQTNLTLILLNKQKKRLKLKDKSEVM